MNKFKTALVALSLVGCMDIDKAPVSNDMSSEAARELINVRANYDSIPTCKDLREKIGMQTLRFIVDVSSISGETALLSDKRTLVTLTTETKEEISKVGLKFEAVDPDDSDGMFLGEITTTCKQ